ncbi:MAG: hypothetical protein E7321_01635 [Clostridiales bacterium]|nr:hypothetical protein [Clostridiales bacterium]
MKKIVIAGAGAYHFAPAIFEDLFVSWRAPVEVWMVDSDIEMAELSARGAQALARAFGCEARFYYTTQLSKATFSADAVIFCADFLDEEGWKKDVEILEEVGLYKQARLRGGVGGAMQTMRVLDFMTDLATQMSEECPDAPLIICDSGFGGVQLARACECAQRMCGVRTLGLSGVTEQTRKRLALYLDMKEEDLDIECAGLNNFSWVTRLRDRKKDTDLIPRCMKEMQEDSREALSSQYIDWYGAIPAGERVMQYELLGDTEVSPKKTVLLSGVGLADYELRKRNLAMLTVHGPLSPEGAKAWGQIRTSGLSSVRPVEVLRALWGEKDCRVDNLNMPCDGAVEGVAPGRFVECPAVIGKDGVHGIAVELPVELHDLMGQLSLCNVLYAEAASTGSRAALREAMEIDPALAGVDLLYTEGVLSDMMEAQKEKLKRFF